MVQNVRSGLAAFEKQLYHLILPTLDGGRLSDSDYSSRVVDLMEKGVCGFMLSGGSREEVASFVSSLEARAGRPLLIAADLERGLGARMKDATEFPCLMAFAAALDFHNRKTWRHCGGLLEPWPRKP